MRKLSDWLTSYMEYTEASEPSEQFRLWTGISAIAAALQRKVSLIWGPDLIFYPNMYIILVGPSGSRKSTAMRPVKSMLNELGIRISSDAITSEALIGEVESAGQNTNTVIIDNVPYFHCSLTVFSEELTVFIGYNNLQMMANLCDWFDCKEKWTYKTKHQGSNELHGVWINLLGATTPDLLQSTLPRDAIGGGLTARMMLIFEQHKAKCVPFPGITEAGKRLREQLVADLERINMMVGEFKVTPGFLEAWAPWYTSQDDKPPFDDDRFVGYIDRRPMHLLKLSMIMSASRTNDMVIDINDFNRAKKTLEKAEIKMRYAFTGIGRSKISEMLIRVVQFLGIERQATRGQLLERFHYDADMYTMDSVLQTLNAMGCISVGYSGREQIVQYIKAPGDVLG